jgi:hypothetical protein
MAEENYRMSASYNLERPGEIGIVGLLGALADMHELHPLG